MGKIVTVGKQRGERKAVGKTPIETPSGVCGRFIFGRTPVKRGNISALNSFALQQVLAGFVKSTTIVFLSRS